MCAPRIPAWREGNAEILLDVAMNTGIGVNEVNKRAVIRVRHKSPYRVAAHQKMSLPSVVFGRIVNTAETHE
jgi:hypothetical protein